MYFLGLAADFDGTIAENGKVDGRTLEALASLKRGGRRLILVTGRERGDLEAVFPEYAMFDRLVLENGGVLLDPSTNQQRVLAPPPDARLVQQLNRLGIERMSVGETVIAAWEPDHGKIFDAIHEAGLELHITFNKGALMVLPTGINKASGLRAAAADLGLAPSAIVGVGDGQNDHSFLRICGCSAAVANAVPSIKAEVDLVLGQDHGAGVRLLVQAVEELDADLLPSDRHGLEIGTSRANKSVIISPNQGNVLVVGPSRAGKSTFATMLIEQMLAKSFGFLVLDPEGDYHNIGGTSLLDATNAAVDVADLEVLLAANLNPVVVLRGVEHHKRQKFMTKATTAAAAMRERTGSPAYLIVDEAHQAFASSSAITLASRPCIFFITVSPKLLDAEVLRSVGTVCALGANADALLRDFCGLTGFQPPSVDASVAAGPGEMLVWRPHVAALVVRPQTPVQAHIRHAGKYATGDVGHERSFYFRGVDNQTCVQARNLFEFLQKGGEVPDEVWSHHLENGDMKRWFSVVFGDPDLADAVEAIRLAGHASARATRDRLRKEISARYCLPVDGVTA